MFLRSVNEVFNTIVDYVDFLALQVKKTRGFVGHETGDGANGTGVVALALQEALITTAFGRAFIVKQVKIVDGENGGSVLGRAEGRKLVDRMPNVIMTEGQQAVQQASLNIAYIITECPDIGFGHKKTNLHIGLGMCAQPTAIVEGHLSQSTKGMTEHG